LRHWADIRCMECSRQAVTELAFDTIRIKLTVLSPYLAMLFANRWRKPR